MSKVKVKRKSTWIDMTAMSDVTVLLLTFFMLTSTFIKKEPVQVVTPSSVSEIKIPEQNVLSILIEPEGKVFMALDRPDDMRSVLRRVGEDYGITFTPEELYQFSLMPSFGMPIADTKNFLALGSEQQDAVLKTMGIPTVAKDSVDSEFKRWVRYSRDSNPDLLIAIKADAKTPYSIIKSVMGSLQDLRENRYNLITSLKGGSTEEH